MNNKTEDINDEAESCIGSVEGVLKAIDFHEKKPFFTIYPAIGAEKIKCIFPKELHDNVIQSLQKKVLVSGEIFYKSKQKFPYKIIVTDLESYPNDSELPGFEDVLGIASTMEDTRPSEEIIREIRDAWD